MTHRTDMWGRKNINFHFTITDTDSIHKQQRNFCALSQIVQMRHFHVIRKWELRNMTLLPSSMTIRHVFITGKQTCTPCILITNLCALIIIY